MARTARHGGGGGAVAAGHAVTAEVGADVLRRGGNACDALIAAGLASWAAEPAVTGPAGGGYLLYHDARSARTVVLDFFVTVPGLDRVDPARPMDSFEIEFGDALQRFRFGVGSCAVPGVPAGLGEAHRRWASRPWAELVAPSIEVARRGFRLSPQQDGLHRILATVLTATPEARAIFAPGGALARTGDVIAQPNLARMLERLAETGVDDLYTGELARRIARFFEREGGAITAADLAAYRVVARRPVAVRFRDHLVTTNAPPSTGGLLLAYALAVQDAFASAADPLGVEAVRLAAAVLREGESRRSPQLVRLLDRGGARRILEPEAIVAGRARVKAELAGAAIDRRPALAARGTTHISVVDAAGNAAAMTCSTGCGSGVVVDDTGLHMNNMLGEDDLAAEGVRLRPGSRLTSMMAPSLITGPDGFEAVVGSSGSARIRSALFRVITALVDHDLPAREAVDLPRLHPAGGALDLEAGVPPATIEGLERLGERVVAWRSRNVYFGGAQVAVRRHGHLEAAGDPRRGGSGVVVA
jgi:gamma-glutamyltranspeptidase/glutathione hydrolase